MSLVMSMGGEGDDEELWFEFRHFFRLSRDRDFFDEPRLGFIFERMFDRQRRSQPESILRQVEKLQSELRALTDKTDRVQVETHSLCQESA